MAPNSFPSSQRAQWLFILAAAFSLSAAIIHFLVTPEHLEEWWGYGLFFLALGTFQGLYAIGLVWLNLSASRTCWYLLIGISGNLSITGLYVVTRTAGIPFFGPLAGEVERVGVPDLLSKALEMSVVAILTLVLLQYCFRRDLHSGASRR